jgi:hypothetical protein
MCFKGDFNLFVHYFSHGSSGNAFHWLGPAHEKDRRPYLSRLCRGIFSWPSVRRNAARCGNQWRKAGRRLFPEGVEYNQDCHCQCHFCSETCIIDCVVLSDSIGFSERGRKREEKRERLRMTDRWPVSRGRKVHILHYSQGQALFIDVEIC